MFRYLADRFERSRSVEILLHSQVCLLIGARTLEAIVVEDSRTGQQSTLAARLLFGFIGADPAGDWLASQLALDREGLSLPTASPCETWTGALPAETCAARRLRLDRLLS
jgi:thioredoxin reductase